MYFYSAQVEAINRDRSDHEMLLAEYGDAALATNLFAKKNMTIPADDMANLFFPHLQVASGGDIGSKNIGSAGAAAPLLEILFLPPMNLPMPRCELDAKGIFLPAHCAGRVHAERVATCRDAAANGRAYNGQALQVEDGKLRERWFWSAVPLATRPFSRNGRCGGGSAVPDSPAARSQRRRSHSLCCGRAGATGGRGHRPQYVTGQDMKSLEIVRNFVDEGTRRSWPPPKEFTVKEGKNDVENARTYSPVTTLDWAVVVQKPQREAYRGVYEMQRTARLLALLAVLVSIGVSIFAARRITNPLQILRSRAAL